MTTISRNTTLPATVWNKLYRGAQKGSECAIQRLFEITEPKIRSMANYAGRNATAKKDLYAVGCEGFMAAINNKAPVKKAQNYIIKYIRLEMQRARQNAAICAKRFLSVDDADCMFKKTMEQSIYAGADSHISHRPATLTLVHELFEYINSLPKKQKDIVLSKIVYGEESKSIAERLKIKSNTVDKTFERIKKNIKKWAEK